MRTLIDLQGRNKTKKTMARADRSSLHGLVERARPKEKGKSPNYYRLIISRSNITTHLLIPVAATLAAIGFLLFSPPPAQAATGVVRRILIQAATSDELDEIVLEPGELVYRVDDPKDVRIGNGTAAGGIRLWNFNALTNPPPVYDRDLDMDGHSIILNSAYRIQAAGGTVTLFDSASNAVFQIVGQEGSGDGGFLRDATFGATPTSIVVVVQHVDGDDAPVVEATDSLISPDWTTIDYELERLTPTTVRLTLPAPELGVFTYYRVSTMTLEASANFAVPLYVQGAPVLTAETDPAFSTHAAYGITSEAIGEWDAAYGWGDHAAAGYLTGFTETDGVFTASAAASIDSDMIADWNGAVGWGNHAAAGYLTGFTETDGVFTASAAYGITSEAISNWNAAAEWGDHAAAGYLSMDGGGLWTFDEYGVAHLYNADGLGISFVDGEFNGGWWGGYKLYIGDSGTFRMGVNAKNIFLRPDGGTNTVSFDESGNMIIAVDGTAAMTISTNGKVGIGLTPDSAFAVNVPSLKSSSSIQGSRFQDASSITYMVDPYGDSKLLNLVLEGTLKASGLPTATNGLDSGTVWSDGGTLKVMP